MRSFLMLWSLAALVLSAVVSAQDYPNNNVTSLEGTWSSGSGGVLTGQGPDSVRVAADADVLQPFAPPIFHSAYFRPLVQFYERRVL